MLTWIRTVHQEEYVGKTKLPDHISLEATLPGEHILKAYSHPYSYGEWTAECLTLGFGGKYFWLVTKDEEEARKLAEEEFRKFVESHVDYYTKVLEFLKPDTSDQDVNTQVGE
jgi:hypothetical protein